MPGLSSRPGVVSAALCAALYGLAAVAAVAVEQRAHASPIAYRRPRAFAQLPRRIVRALERLRCRVPQAVGVPQPNNVIAGAFLNPHERDWAVLCSRNARSAILVFDASHGSPVETLRGDADADFLQDVGNGVLGFSRLIDIADRAYIRQHEEWYGNTPPQPPINHDGIDAAFVGKASIILYRYRGSWRELQGAD